MLKRLMSDAFHLVFWNLETVFKVTGAWFVIQFVLTLGIQVLAGQTEPGAAPSAATTLGAFLVMVVSLVASSSIAVAWHRFALLGDRPGMIHLHFGKTEGMFLLKSLMLGACAGLAFFLVFLVGGLTGGAVAAGVIGLIVAYFAIPTFIRFSLILPATAVERPIGLRQAYGISEGLGWRLFFASFALSLPFGVLMLLLQFLVQQLSSSLPVIFIQLKIVVLSVLVQILLTVLSISVLTAGYRIAMERQQPASG
ncbi:hypothetical protein E1178_06610 [Roseibium hamelinense]|nr:hypothetical protein [Roseibium hamelinense]MTI43279.1 hypothetical protein [Roseibium hamelinense]